MPTPTGYKVTVVELHDGVPTSNTAVDSTSRGRETFSQIIPATDFDQQTFVLALNKRRRVRAAKARKEEKTDAKN